MNYSDFDLACQRAIMEMVIPGLAHLYKEVKFYWPINLTPGYHQHLIGDNYDFTTCEIMNRKGGQTEALIYFENSLMVVYNFRSFEDLAEKFSIDISDPDVHHKIFNYLEKLIKSIV